MATRPGGDKPKTRNLIIKPSSGTNKSNLVPVEERIQLKYFRYYIKGFREGIPTSKLVADFSTEFGTSRDVAQVWRDKALEALSHYAVKDAEQVRSIQMERLEHIYNLAVERQQLKTAQSILDTMNKLMGLYKDTTMIIQPVTEFNFGGDDNKTIRITQNPYETELDGVVDPDEINKKAEEIMEDISSSRWRQEDL